MRAAPSIWVRHFAALLVLVCGALPCRAELAQSLYAIGLTMPTNMAFAPDGRLFVCEQAGAVRIVRDGILQPKPFVRVQTAVVNEDGLLGIAFDPSFATNSHVYLFYTTASPFRHNVIVRYTADGDTVASGSATTVFDLDQVSAYIHQGGGLHFGPDGMLYVSVGDNGNGALSHAMNSTHGKVLRIRGDGSIPEDNPWYGTASDKYRSIWAVGFRNPYSFAIRPSDGLIYVNDVGQDRFEEVSPGVAGGDYGWPGVEGPDVNPGRVHPAHFYDHDEGCAITGGAFYEAPTPLLPSRYVGRYFYGDYCADEIRVLDTAAPESYERAVTTLVNAPVDLDAGPDGALYYLARGATPAGGAVVRVTDANTAPTVAMLAPAPGTTYDAGDTLALSGTASDLEDGTLPLTALTWSIEFHHGAQSDVVLPPTAASEVDRYVIPRTGETATDVWYRVTLTATDVGGRSTETRCDVHPNLTTIELSTLPPGLKLTLDDLPVDTPLQTATVVGLERRVGVVSPQSLGGVDYGFKSWSNAGKPAQIVAPTEALVLEATFEEVDTSTEDPGAPGDSTNAGIPAGLRLEPVTPNPVARFGTLRFALPAAGHVRLDVLDVSGRVRARPADGEFPAGLQAIRWNAAHLPPGVYLVALHVGSWREWRRMVVTR